LTESVGADGHASPTYATVDTVYGSVTALSGRELINAQQISSLVTHRVKIRYHASVNNHTRFKMGSRVFYVEYIDNKRQMDYWLICICREDTILQD